MKPRFQVGDIIRTRGGKTPWRIESIGNGTLWHTRGVQAYRCVSLTSGRHDEYRVNNDWIDAWSGQLPEGVAKPLLVKGHTLRGEGAPHDAAGRRIGNGWSGRGSGRGKCSCGELSEVLHSAGQRRQWHREHKDAIRAGQVSA